MRRLKKIFIRLVLLITLSTCSQNQNSFEVQVTLLEFGKVKNLPEGFYGFFEIEKKNITSALYAKLANNNNIKIKMFIVNDAVFNYKYFNKVIYPKLRETQVVLKVKKQIIENEEYYLVTEIRKK